MSNSRSAAGKLWWRAVVFVAAPTACAVATQPDVFDEEPRPSAGSAGAAGHGGRSGTPAGGSLGTSGKGGSEAKSGAGGAGGRLATGGKGGGAGAGGTPAGNAGSSGAGAGGNGPLTCACPKPLTWQDAASLSWTRGDCLEVDDQLYLYIGTKPQTFANPECKPTRQLAWCTDTTNDFKFMACN